MKKTLLALTITGLLATTAQAANVYDADGESFDVYGRIQFDIKDPGSDADVTGVGTARFGLKGSTEVTSELNAIAHGEWQLDAENSNGTSEISARHVYLGVDHDTAGKLVFGQTDTAFYQAVAATDIFNSYGYAAYTGIEDGRQEGQINYTGQFGDVYVGSSFQFANDAFKVSMGNPSGSLPNDTGLELDSAFALTLGYNFAFGLDIYAGYHAENLSGGSEDGTKTNLALSAAYSVGDLYLGAAVVSADYSGDTLQANNVVLLDGSELMGYDLVASYNVQDNVSVYGGYAVLDADGTIESSDSLADEFTLGAQYKLNSNSKVWAEYKVDNVDGNDNVWTIAAQYNF